MNPDLLAAARHLIAVAAERPASAPGCDDAIVIVPPDAFARLRQAISIPQEAHHA
jgi:hypothetical protein